MLPLQVHGYNLSTVCFPTTPGFPHRMVSGADEKILRVFDAPECFLRLLRGVVGGSVDTGEVDQVPRVEQAFVPELALSSKVRGHASGIPAYGQCDLCWTVMRTSVAYTTAVVMHQ